MKKTSRNVVILLLVLTFFIGYRIFDYLYPYAKPLKYPDDYPSVEDVLKVTIETPDGETTDVKAFAPLIMQIQQVKPTRKQSVNDFPTVDFYYRVVLITATKEFHYFIYEKNHRVYLEIPYRGIYVAKHHSGRDSFMEMISNLRTNHSVN